ncbi:MAG: biotin-dependent carboxyltransferase family protein [Armatimonadetes bacterium]|nr:biotin-dependent carboxyltransferase family protein [Armatimonadota bacterium]
MGAIQVTHRGLWTTLQDLGRDGFQQYGVIVGGAMDTFALRAANLLVGNDEGEAALEITMQGPTLRFEGDAWIAVCGGRLNPTVSGQPLQEWRPARVRSGETLKFGAATEGCRAYLAIAGGFDVPPVMGSRSFYARAGIGGVGGQPLKDGDRLHLRSSDSPPPEGIAALPEGEPLSQPDWEIGSEVRPDYRSLSSVRVLPGSEFQRFTQESRRSFFDSPFQVTSQSDRMGYRLSGPPLTLDEPLELLSEAVSPGTVQVTPEGHPILLMADAPATGGYPKIAHVITVDLPLLAQAKPGESVRFLAVSLTEAQDLYRRRERDFQLIRQGIALAWRQEMHER